MAKEKQEKKERVSKKQEKKKVEKKGIIASIKAWFKGVFKEVKNVRWPNKKEMAKYSVATIMFILFFAAFFFVVELIMTFILSFLG